MIEGFDVSHHQDPLLWDWQGLQRRKVRFMVARATYGKATADKQFTRFAEHIRSHGLVFGAYLFYRQIHSVEDQLALFERQINDIGGLKSGEMFPVLDMEENASNGDKRPEPLRFSEDCQRIAKVLRAQYGGVILYYSSYFPEYLNKQHRTWMLESRYRHWLADYDVAPGAPRNPYTPSWHLHQPRPRIVPEYAQSKVVVDYDVANPETRFEDLLIGQPSVRPVDVSTALGQRRALNLLAYSRPSLPEITEDSRALIAAIGHFQGSHPPLVIDGIAGPKTQKALLQKLAEK